MSKILRKNDLNYIYLINKNARSYVKVVQMIKYVIAAQKEIIQQITNVKNANKKIALDVIMAQIANYARKNIIF